MLPKKQAFIARNLLYKSVREFFNTRNVLEVETPLLAAATITDPYINSFEVFNPLDVKKLNKYYLQTSPEFAMKRLLCENIGSIFQICKVFRAEEIGRKHNIEFTMLEWYRMGFKLEDLMNEMAELLSSLLASKLTKQHDAVNNCVKFTYKDLFLHYLDFDHNLVDIEFLKNKIRQLYNDQFDSILNDKNFNTLYDKDDLLMILLSNYIEPKLEHNKIIFLYDYPPTQAALSQLDYTAKYPVAKRFEVYFNGLELANGFYELGSSSEQEKRFNLDLEKRRSQRLPEVSIDRNLLSALNSGMPDCSGVALGLDRVLMLQMGAHDIEDVLAFRL